LRISKNIKKRASFDKLRAGKLRTGGQLAAGSHFNEELDTRD
jgi:hypothetical protein